ncbi:MAG TPA: sugar-binding transcriptional regulator [Chloroflexota bacterium]|nr:sugar-binding transcriptional regulator [Chloroflexota bacterium]
MTFDETRAVLTRVAWLYYIEQLSQQEIADRLRLSRVKVTRLLQRARDEKIVEVRIADANAPWQALERRLVQRFGLRDAVVMPSEAGERLRRHLGQAAAAYLERILRAGDVVGIGSGATLSEIPDFIGRGPHPRCLVVELIGGLSRTDRGVNPYDCSWRLAEALDARSEHLQVPAMVESAGIVDILLGDSVTRAALERAASCDIAFVGVGQMDSPIRATMDYVPRPVLDRLAAAGAVGDILLRFFDAAGRQVPAEFDEQVIGLTLDQLRRVPLVVGVAGGLEKTRAIAGALHGGLVDVIICDQATAAAVLAEPDAAPGAGVAAAQTGKEKEHALRANAP